MFTKSSIETKLDALIIAQLDKLDGTQDTKEYDTIIDRIAALHKLKSNESDTTIASITAEQKLASETRIKPPSMDAMLAVGANLLGIVWLTRYEREHVITSKALGFVLKPR